MSWLDLSYGKGGPMISEGEATLSSVGGDWPLSMVFGEEDLSAEEFGDEQESEQSYILETALDEKVCEICGPLEGEIFPESALEEEFPDAEFDPDGSVRLNAHSPRDPYCRCIASPIEDESYEDAPFDMESEVAAFNEAYGGGWF